MTYEEIEREYPDEWQRRKADKLAYRYSIPQGVLQQTPPPMDTRHRQRLSTRGRSCSR